jgi:hypothetical protein
VKPENVEVWFQDEARFGLRGTLSRIWAIQGTRPRMVRQQQSTAVYLFGAVCPQQDKAVGLACPVVNTETMQFHVNEISNAVAPGRHGLLLCDRAAWHTTDKLVIPENITMLPLPAYSPELNPAEQVWEVLRKDSLSNRCFSNYENLVDSCCSAWNQFVEQVGAVSALCSRTWAVLWDSS